MILFKIIAWSNLQGAPHKRLFVSLRIKLLVGSGGMDTGDGDRGSGSGSNGTNEDDYGKI